MKSLYSIQEQHVKRLEGILNSPIRAALDSSATGTGKTVCAAEIAKRHPGQTVVICPKAVIPSWTKELTERGVPVQVTNYEKLRAGSLSYGTWDAKGKHWLWKCPKDTLLIFDEVHKCAGDKTQNSEILIEAKRQGYKILMLSATVASSPSHLRATGYVLGLHKLQDFQRFCMANGCKRNYWGVLEYAGSVEAMQILGKALAPLSSRMTVADLQDHFMDTQIITEPLEFGDSLAGCYAEMQAELAELAEKSKYDSTGAAANALVIQLRARQRVELLKVPVMLEMTRDALTEGKSVALFVNFQQTLDALAEKFENARVIHGKQTAKERQAGIEAFQEDRCRVIVCNTAAGGVGVSLHDVTGKHPRLAIISPDWNEKAIVQTMGRVHRAGGKTHSQQRVLFAAETVEADVEKSLRKKIRNMEILNEETAGQLPTKVEPTAPEIMPAVTPDPAPCSQGAIVQAPHSERKHAQYSPSALKMFEACPSFQKRDGTNAIAEQGTKIHEALESGDLSGLNDVERDIAEFCFGFRAHVREEKAATGAKVTKSIEEIKFNIDLETEKTFGSCDLIELYDDGSAVMMDWKTGYGAVEDAEINAQLWAYTLGAFQKFPEIEKLDAYLVLPRRQEISSATFLRSDVPKLKLRLGTIIARAKELSGSFFSPKEGVCDYCGGRGSCQALADKALVIGDKSGFVVPETVDLASADPAEKAKLLKLANLLTDWAADVKKELLRQALEEGAELPGYRLDQRRTPRTIASPLGAWEVVKDSLSLDEFINCATRISVTSLETAYAEKAPKGKKTASKSALNDLLQDAGVMGPEGVVHVLKAVKA